MPEWNYFDISKTDFQPQPKSAGKIKQEKKDLEVNKDAFSHSRPVAGAFQGVEKRALEVISAVSEARAC